jgi:hypothetical protein
LFKLGYELILPYIIATCKTFLNIGGASLGESLVGYPVSLLKLVTAVNIESGSVSIRSFIDEPILREDGFDIT